MDEDGFARFVVDRRAALLRTALLLTGDRGSAEDLVQRALGRARGSAAPDDVVLRALVRGATSRWTRLTRREQVIEALEVAPGPAPGLAPGLATALRELPARTRAVVVLRWYEQLPDARIAALLGGPVEAVDTEAGRGLAALTPALAPSAYERAGPELPAPQRLTAGLTGLAGAGRWRLDPTEALADVSARRSGTRRRVALATVAALCVAGVAVPLARWAPDGPPVAAPAATSPVSSPPAQVVARSVPVLVGPTRGSLAGDTAFLEAVRSAGWGAQDAPPPDQRTVVFAGDTPDGRVALVVGTVLEDFRGVWLTGPVGAAAADLTPHVPARLGEERPLTLLLGGPGEATLVVVAAPGDQIAVSDRLMTGPRGTVSRAYPLVPMTDGVAVVPARTTSLGSSLSVEVTRAGRQVYRSDVDWLGEPAPTPLPPLAPLRAGVVPEPHVVAAALADLAVPLGVEPGLLQPQVLWSADLPLGRGTGSVVVLVGDSPGGALVVTTWVGWAGGAVSCGTQTPPGTTEVDTLTVARLCTVAAAAQGQGDDGRWLVVSAPGDAASAELLDGRGRVLGSLVLTAGGAVVPMADGARTVRTLDAAGRPLRETAIAPAPTEPFGDFGPGPVS